MKIRLTSVLVDDQEKALQFYTKVLGFEKKMDIPMGAARWLTVISPEGPADMQLLLEPNSHPAARAFQEAIFKDGIPLTAFAVDDIATEFERLKAHGVAFKQPPTPAGPVTLAVFDDTCGNLIQIYQPAA
jgi:catechol 2,3-dioxygenase-like lactoylglutathione lyase family enzyme